MHVQALQAGSKLHYDFYEEQDGNEAAGGVRVIDLKQVDKYLESEHEILFQLVKQFNVPEKQRCAAQHITCLDHCYTSFREHSRYKNDQTYATRYISFSRCAFIHVTGNQHRQLELQVVCLSARNQEDRFLPASTWQCSVREQHIEGELAWCRFQLLTRISAARNFATLQGRRHTAAVRLLALFALFLCNPSTEALTEFYAAEPDFVQVSICMQVLT